MRNPLRRRKQGKSKGEEGYGEGKVTIDFGDDVLIDEEAMVEQLLKALSAPDYRPPTLPAVAVDLMSLSQQPDVDFDDVVVLLEQDSMIAGRIIKMVQSPIYAGASQLTSLRDALVRLGLKTLRDVVMQIAMNMKVFRSPDYADTMDLIRRHCTMTAHLSKVVSKYSPMDGDYAFLAGLLHDAGIAGTLLALSDNKGKRKTPPDLIAIWPAVDRVHTRAAELMADHWNLPPDIKLVMRNHHQVILEGHAHPLAATVCLADDLAHSLGFGVIPKADAKVEAMTELERDCVRSHTSVDRSTPKTLEHAKTALQLTDAEMDLIQSDAEEVVQNFG
ncbi:MAG: HDOD domain-containing protein [Myxococcales bacterium]|nr:HDOD domain-containing protein [Myxococcales bacterium]